MTNEDAIYFLLRSNEYHHAKGDLPHSALSVEAFNKAIEALKAARPQGEWIKVKEDRMSIDMSGEIVTGYKCSICGRYIVTLPSKLADYPFCHCGAEMKGGTE